MKKSSFIVAAYLFLTFASGAAVGGFGYWLYSTRTVSANRRPTPEEYRQRYLAEYKTRLNLNDEQVQKLASILDATGVLFRQIADKHRPEYEAIQQHQVEQVRAILNEAQKGEYEKIRIEREKKRRFGPRPAF